jgi:hypothetical protein
VSTKKVTGPFSWKLFYGIVNHLGYHSGTMYMFKKSHIHRFDGEAGDITPILEKRNNVSSQAIFYA